MIPSSRINPTIRYDQSKIIKERLREEKTNIHTSDGYGLGSLLRTGQKDNILLRGVDIAILEKEDFLNTMLLKRREFDKKANSTG